MTKITARRLEAVKSLFAVFPPNHNWQVTSETSFPTFSGGVTTEVVSNRHGTYTTEEIFKAEYQLDGWLEAGYKIVRGRTKDVGLIVVELVNGPINVAITYQAYAS